MADNGIRKFIVTRRRLRRSLHPGFRISEEGVLSTEGEQLHRHCILAKLDSNLDDCPWGRLAMDANLEGELFLTVRAFGSNDRVFIQRGEVTDIDEFLLDGSVPASRKEQLFGLGNGVEYSGAHDVLLYGQTGRYLWIWLELSGPGRAELSNLRVYAPGDNFFATFPQVYQNNGAFFHRYLSIFSSLYQDLQERIDGLAGYVVVDTAPAPLLGVLAGWLGLKLDGDFLEDAELRRLLKSASALLRMKGTRQAIEGIVKIFVEEPVYLVEYNLLSAAQRAGSGGLYGNTPFDFAILICRRSDERLRAKIQLLVEQFKPVRSRVHIVFLGDMGGLDAFSYLDINAVVMQSGPGRLDDGEALAGTTYLQ